MGKGSQLSATPPSYLPNADAGRSTTATKIQPLTGTDASSQKCLDKSLNGIHGALSASSHPASTSTNTQQAPRVAECGEAKGRRVAASRYKTAATTVSFSALEPSAKCTSSYDTLHLGSLKTPIRENMPSFTTAAVGLGFPCEVAEPAAEPTTVEHVPTSATVAQNQTGPVPVSVPASGSQKKALLIGLNYERCGKSYRLRHATRDAQRFKTTLTKLGFADRDVMVVTDEEDQPLPTSEYLINAIDWLVQGASKGDQLIFMFSGHCEPAKFDGIKETHFVAADSKGITRSTFEEHLVSKVPAGAELKIVLDCCNAAGMVKLQYCIGKMEYEQEGRQTTSPRQGPPRRGGVAAAAPLPSAAGPSRPPVVTASSMNQRAKLQSVVEGRPLGYFKEREGGFITPAGKVVLFAGASERQKSFEASGNAEHGVITDAICTVLEAYLEKAVTLRDVWHSIAGAVHRENTLRNERDISTKDMRKLPLNFRWQCSQVWASQEEPVHSSSPILDAPVFWQNMA